MSEGDKCFGETSGCIKEVGSAEVWGVYYCIVENAINLHG